MFQTIILLAHSGHLFRRTSLCLGSITTIRSYERRSFSSMLSGVCLRNCWAFSLARYLSAASEMGIEGLIPAESTWMSGLYFFNKASANGLRKALPKHTNRTFIRLT